MVPRPAVLSKPETPPARRVNWMLGTWFTAEISDADGARASAALDAVFAEAKRLERLLSRFIGESEVSRVNREGAREPVAVGAETFELIQQSARLAQESVGALDITLAPLTDLWKKAEKRGFVPTPGEIEEWLSRTGCRHLELDAGTRSVFFQKKGMGIDLGSVGKGYILDRAMEAATKFGVPKILINAGGNIVCRSPEETAVGIRSPLRAEDVIASVLLTDEAVATSAADQRHFDLEGRKYGHILDPRTGRPAESGLLSVSVVAPTAFIADALSTILYVIGPERGLGVARRLGARQVVIVRRSTRLWRTRLEVEQISL